MNKLHTIDHLTGYISGQLIIFLLVFKCPVLESIKNYKNFEPEIWSTNVDLVSIDLVSSDLEMYLINFFSLNTVDVLISTNLYNLVLAVLVFFSFFGKLKSFRTVQILKSLKVLVFFTGFEMPGSGKHQKL